MNATALLKRLVLGGGPELFSVNPDYFPRATQDVFSMDIMIKHGVLPLGFKTKQTLFGRSKILNLGLLSTEKEKPLKRELEAIAKEKLGESNFSELKFYRVEPRDFVRVLDRIYGVPLSQIEHRPPSDLDETLRSFAISLLAE